MGEGSQILFRFGGGCRTGCCLMCVWVRVRRFWFVLGVGQGVVAVSNMHYIYVYINIFMCLCCHCLWTILIKVETCMIWIGLTNCGNGSYLFMLFGVYAGMIFSFNFKWRRYSRVRKWLPNRQFFDNSPTRKQPKLTGGTQPGPILAGKESGVDFCQEHFRWKSTSTLKWDESKHLESRGCFHFFTSD